VEGLKRASVLASEGLDHPGFDCWRTRGIVDEITAAFFEAFRVFSEPVLGNLGRPLRIIFETSLGISNLNNDRLLSPFSQACACLKEFWKLAAKCL
jgi:hypothetical protein